MCHLTPCGMGDGVTEAFLTVEHTLLYLAGILSKSGERDVPGGSEVW